MSKQKMLFEEQSKSQLAASIVAKHKAMIKTLKIKEKHTCGQSRGLSPTIHAGRMNE
jgi:hypothetical protein